MNVCIYYNLHKKIWSIKAMDGKLKGKVVSHAKRVVVENAVPKISEAGRQRVLREKQKNVHAGIIGVLVGLSEDATGSLDMPIPEAILFQKRECSERITYNPYLHDAFVLGDDHSKGLVRADRISFREDRCVYAEGITLFDRIASL